MRLTGWHVDGYGHYRDRDWRDLPAGLTVFHGPNEAGKSTLLSFLESVFFGFRDGRARQPAIPALAGGRHGGRVFLDDDGAGWTVERMRSGGLAVAGPGGAGGEADLRRLLGGVDRELFSSVFAFSLRELEDLGGLGDDAFRQRLFAAGLTGVGRSAHDALATLERRAQAQYRQRGASRLKDLWDELDALKAERRDAREALEGYPALRAAEDEWCAAIARADAEGDELRRRSTRLERLNRVWGVLARRAAVEDALAALPAGPDVAGDVADEALTLETRIAEHEAALAELQARVADRKEARDGIAIDEDALRSREAVRALQADAAAHRGRLEARADTERDRDDAARRLASARAEVGPGWSRERILGFDASVPVRDAAERWASTLDGAARALEDARSGVRRRAEELDEAAEAADRAEAARDAVPPTRELSTVDRELAALDRLRAGLDALGERRRDTEAADARVHDHEAAGTEDAAGPTAAEPARLLGWIGFVALVLGLALAAAGQVAGGLATALVGVVVAAVSWAAVRRADDAADRERAAAARTQARAERGEALRRRRDEARAALQEARVRVGRDAEAAGFAGAGGAGFAGAGNAADGVGAADGAGRGQATDTRATADAGGTVDAPGVPSYDAIADRARALTAERERAVDRARLGVAAHEAAEALARAGALHDAALDAEREAAQAADAAATDWQAWRVALGVPEDLPPPTVVRLVDVVLRARDLLLDVDRHEARIADLTAQIDAWVARAREVLRDAGRDGGGEPDAVRGGHRHAAAAPHRTHDRAETAGDAIRRLHDDAEAAADAAARRAALTTEVDRLTGEVRALAGRLAAARGRLAELLAAHGVETRDELVAAVGATAERRRSRSALAELDVELRASTGAGEDAERLISDAQAGAVEAWAAERTGLARELRELAATRDAAVHERALATAKREALEASADLARIDGRIEEVRAEAAVAAAAFRTTLGAQRLIRDTLAAYVDDRQPQVLRDASASFAEVTDGRYPRIRQGSTTHEALELEDAAGRTVDPVTLSRGTREQLYLCLRLALAKGVAAGGTPLPMIMDDVLVNFSPDRAEAMATVLAEVAREQQVLFFTCHPATRDLLRRTAGECGAGEVRVEELQRA
jgi:uncharacterized protein YhaN